VVELLIAWTVAWAALALAGAAAVALAVRGARRRSRARAERVLDALADEACAALAHDDSSRRTARAIARYDRAQGLVATARTCRELEAAVAREHLRLAASELAGRGVERVRALLPAGAALRR
jgi:hypothetical protein